MNRENPSKFDGLHSQIKSSPCMRLLSLAPALTAALVLLAQNDLLREINYITLLPLVGAALILIFFNRRTLARGRAALFAAALTVLFLVMLPVTTLISCPLAKDTADPVLRGFFRFGYPIVTALSVYVCVAFFLSSALSEKKKMGAPLLRLRPVPIYACLIPLAFAALACVLAALPSLLVGDAPTIWHLAENGIWDEWHTAGYLMFVRGLYAILPSQTLVTLAEAALYLYASQKTLAALEAAGVPSRGCHIYIAASIAAFAPLYYLGIMIKDTVFSASLLLFGALLLNAVHRDRLRLRDTILLGVAGAFVSVFRLAGVLPVAVSITLLFLFLVKNKRRALPAVLAAVIAASGFIGVKLYFDTRPDNRQNPYYLTYSIPMQMIADLAYRGLDFPDGDRAVVEEIMPLEDWAACFHHYHSDAVSRDYGKIGHRVNTVSEKRLGPALVKVNLHLFLKYPKEYATAFFDQNSLIWEISTPPGGYTRVLLWYPAAESSAEAPEGTRFTGFAAPVNRLGEFLYENPITRPLVWRGGFALFLTFLAAAALLLKGRSADLMGLLPFWTVTFGLLFSLPAQESRYILPNLLFGVLYTVYALYVPSKSTEDCIQ